MSGGEGRGDAASFPAGAFPGGAGGGGGPGSAGEWPWVPGARGGAWGVCASPGRGMCPRGASCVCAGVCAAVRASGTRGEGEGAAA